MQYHILKSGFDLLGNIALDGSKSISNRALLINALSNEPVKLQNLSTSDDTHALAAALSTQNELIDVGAAGTTMRFLTAYLAVGKKQHTLTGSERMKKRPIKILVEALHKLGADIRYLGETGFPPLQIVGKKLEGGVLEVDSGVSSQYISALLMIAPLLNEGLCLFLRGKGVSESYLQMTIDVMKQFGVQVHKHGQFLVVEPQSYVCKTGNYAIESDWSAASYYYAMAAFCHLRGGRCHLYLDGLQGFSSQGDSVLQHLMPDLGVQTSFTEKGILLNNGVLGAEDKPIFEHDFVLCPDIAQTLAVVCGGLGKDAVLSGLQTLQIKETDRTQALANELQKLNVAFTPYQNRSDVWQLASVDKLPEQNVPIIDTYDDHRMAMSFAPLAMLLPQGIIINHPQVVSKSYPNFWKDLQTLGFQIYEL